MVSVACGCTDEAIGPRVALCQDFGGCVLHCLSQCDSTALTLPFSLCASLLFTVFGKNFGGCVLHCLSLCVSPPCTACLCQDFGGCVEAADMDADGIWMFQVLATASSMALPLPSPLPPPWPCHCPLYCSSLAVSRHDCQCLSVA